jgi:valyl-tRNA synthetase
VPADGAARATIEGGIDYLAALARVTPIEVRASGDDRDRPDRIASTAGAAAWIAGGGVAGADPSRLAANEAHLRRGIERLEALLAGDFARRAPAEVVERERARLADLQAELRLLTGS